MIKNYKEYLAEAIGDDPRIPHPEDSILKGSAEAEKFIRVFDEMIAQPEKFSTKWDGGIALYFGHTANGEFFIDDKYMYPAGFYAKSPEDWQRYDTEIKKSRLARSDLYPKISAIWPGLQKSVGNTPGVFKGDLMMVDPEGLKPAGNNFVFGTVTVKYTVPIQSPLGQLMQNKVALIVVHAFNGSPWDGRTGLANVSNVALIPPNLNFRFEITDKTEIISLINDAKSQLAGKKQIIDQFLNGLDNVARGLLGQYLNKIRTQATKDTIDIWLKDNANKKQYNNLVGDGTTGYLARNKAGLDALYNVWHSMFRVKESLVLALESQIQGFSQQTSAGPGGEGFVFPSSIGLVKLVNPNFSSSHFNKPH